MKEQVAKIKIFNFSHPLMVTEGLSLLGSKFSRALPFEWSLTNDFTEAQIVIWDGFINPKNETIIKSMLTQSASSKILLVMGETATLFEGHPILKKADLSSVKYVELPGWNILPEELLSALEECYKKMTNV